MEENRWWLDHAASIVRFWKAIINKRSQYVDGTSLGVHICQTIAGYQHETPSGTQIAGADSKSRPSTASGATIWLRSGSQYRWLEGLAYRLTQHASTSPIPYPWSTHQFASICYDLTGFFLGWVAWNHLGESMLPGFIARIDDLVASLTTEGTGMYWYLMLIYSNRWEDWGKQQLDALCLSFSWVLLSIDIHRFITNPCMACT